VAARPPRVVPTVSVVGRHNSGKTTFLLALLPILVGRGLRVGYLKHAHAGFDIDRPDKDSGRIGRTGVVQTMITGGGRTAVIDASGEMASAEVIARYARTDLDLVVIEGFKREPLPKIEVARLAVSKGQLVCAEPPQRHTEPDIAGPVLRLVDAEVVPAAMDPELDQLTPREKEVLRQIARGYSYKQVARRLSISIKTVESHVSAVLRKLQLSSRYELTRWATDRRII